jgi:hypothetical protein
VRPGTNSSAIVVGANLGLLCLFFVTDQTTSAVHLRVPTTAPVPARLARHPTCYRLAFSDTSWYVATPHEVELIDSLYPPWSGEIRRRAIGHPDRASDIAFWSTAGVDSITIVFLQGAIGVAMRVSVTRNALTGHAWAFSDTDEGWMPADAIVRADPISCAEVRPAARPVRSGRS